MWLKFQQSQIFVLQLTIKTKTKLTVNVQVMPQPLKGKNTVSIPLICAVCLIAPALAISMLSHVLPEGSTGMSLHCTLYDQMNWSKASSAADFPQPMPRRCLWSRKEDGTPAYVSQ